LLWSAQPGGSLLNADADARQASYQRRARERLSIVALSGDEYADALAASAALGIVGGAIYDAMLAHCAIKSKAEAIYSWNGRHYALCGSEITQRLRTP
jgi:predicted nucleic acid-binding protein